MATGERSALANRFGDLHEPKPAPAAKICLAGVGNTDTIIETCRRLDINLREYLTEVLPKLGDWPINRVAELTPTAWKAAKAKKN